MTVFLAFMFGVFVLSCALERRGGRFPARWLLAITVLVSLSFYSLRLSS